MIKADEIRQQNADYRQAFFISWLLAPHLKKPIAPKTIYEQLWPPDPDKIAADKADEKKYLIKAFKLDKVK